MKELTDLSPVGLLLCYNLIFVAAMLALCDAVKAQCGTTKNERNEKCMRRNNGKQRNTQVNKSFAWKFSPNKFKAFSAAAFTVSEYLFCGCRRRSRPCCITR